MNSQPSFQTGALTLFLAAEGPGVCAGLSLDRSWIQWVSRKSGAVEGLIPAVNEVLGRRPLASVSQFVYTSGPGGLLGLRTLSAAIRTWSVLYPAKAFFCLSGMIWTARRLQIQMSHHGSFSLVAPARSGFWNALTISSPSLPLQEDLQLIADEKVANLPPPVYLIPHREPRNLPRPDFQIQQEDFSALPTNWTTPGLLQSGRGELFLRETSDYTPWTPTRHR